ncbi:MAG TPA: DNA double-strand break repair nuclease NurA, partial [Chroococcales cyanobacterium]
MLDFNKLIEQIDLIGLESFVDTDSQKEVIDNASAAFLTAAQAGEQLIERLIEDAPWVLWPVAVPLEPLGSTYQVEAKDFNLTVVGVDGSQIMPSHHEVNTCFLLNIGLAMISYGIKQPPLLSSIPRLFHRPDEL